MARGISRLRTLGTALAALLLVPIGVAHLLADTNPDKDAAVTGSCHKQAAGQFSITHQTGIQKVGAFYWELYATPDATTPYAREPPVGYYEAKWDTEERWTRGSSSTSCYIKLEEACHGLVFDGSTGGATGSTFQYNYTKYYWPDGPNTDAYPWNFAKPYAQDSGRTHIMIQYHSLGRPGSPSPAVNAYSDATYSYYHSGHHGKCDKVEVRIAGDSKIDNTFQFVTGQEAPDPLGILPWHIHGYGTGALSDWVQVDPV